jgi:hypothetical protein
MINDDCLIVVKFLFDSFVKVVYDAAYFNGS